MSQYKHFGCTQFRNGNLNLRIEKEDLEEALIRNDITLRPAQNSQVKKPEPVHIANGNQTQHNEESGEKTADKGGLKTYGNRPPSEF